MSLKTIKQEVAAFISNKVGAQQIVNIDFVIHEIMASKPQFEGEDAEFYLWLAHRELKEIVKSCVAKYNAKENASRQISLPGFEYLQVAYPVQRDGDSLLVPIDRMTEAEINERAEEYEVMGKGCFKHASELRGYASKRNASNDNTPSSPAIAA
ncbi:hypothetical protein F9K77_14290 [Ochrobactrum sp. LMG 5442]|nr:hypothetical protein F9K77_14290 [Ochrobactrum sp. LMG 5442]